MSQRTSLCSESWDDHGPEKGELEQSKSRLTWGMQVQWLSVHSRLPLPWGEHKPSLVFWGRRTGSAFWLSFLTSSYSELVSMTTGAVTTQSHLFTLLLSSQEGLIASHPKGSSIPVLLLGGLLEFCQLIWGVFWKSWRCSVSRVTRPR